MITWEALLETKKENLAQVIWDIWVELYDRFLIKLKDVHPVDSASRDNITIALLREQNREWNRLSKEVYHDALAPDGFLLMFKHQAKNSPEMQNVTKWL